MKKFEFKRLKIFRIFSFILIVAGIIILCLHIKQPQQQNQIFQLETASVQKEIDVSQNIPIPEDVQKIINERLEQERIAKEKAEAEQKEKEEAERKAKEEEIKIAKEKQKITSRSSVVRQESNVTIATGTKGEYQAYARDLCLNDYGWTEYDVQCLIKLWERESNWNPNAHNKSSNAHGIPQSLPASKMASEGADYYTNGKTQIRWGLGYIAGRYGSPSNAWAHSQSKGWY